MASSVSRRQLPHRQRQILKRWQQQGNLSALHHALKRLLPQAQHCFEYWYLYGVWAEHAQQYTQAEQAYRRAICYHPQHLWSWYRLGRMYQERGQANESLQALYRYYELSPTPVSSDIYLHLGKLLAFKRQDEAALVFYLKALEHENPDPSVYFYLFQSLDHLGELNTALQCLAALGAQFPDKQPFFSMLMGYSLELQGEIDRARQAYQTAIQRLPRQWLWQLKLALAYPLVAQNRNELDTAGQRSTEALEAFLVRLEQHPIQLDQNAFFNLTMLQTNSIYMSYHHNPTLNQRRLLGQVIQRVVKRPERWQSQTIQSSQQQIHLGIVIAAKSIGLSYLYAVALADQLHPERFRVTLFCSSPDIKRLFNPQQAIHVKGAHMQIQLLDSQPYQALAEVRKAQLDALFLTEPGWDFQQYLMGLHRAAPVQFTSWMNPGSSGLSEIDYFLSSQWIEPAESQQHYSETLCRWPTFPSWVPRISAPQASTREDFGLETEWHVYGCLQNLLKFHPDFDVLLAEILRRDPLGHLVLVSSRDRQHLASLLMQRFEKNMPELMPRIWVFPQLENAQFLQLLSHCDVLLDPPYYGGGTTSYQAMALGLPLITRFGERLTSCISAGLYRAMGIEDTLAESDSDYVLKALYFAQNPKQRQTLKQRILSQNHRLFENAEALHCFEDFLLRSTR